MTLLLRFTDQPGFLHEYSLCSFRGGNDTDTYGEGLREWEIRIFCCPCRTEQLPAGSVDCLKGMKIILTLK